MIRKIHFLKKKGGKKLLIWGDGTPKRELIYVDDLADACVYFMKKKTNETIINIRTGKDFSIKQYAKIFLDTIYPNSNVAILYDKSKPNGTPRKVMNVNLAKKYGWKAKTNIKKAINITYKDFVDRKIK